MRLKRSTRLLTTILLLIVLLFTACVGQTSDKPVVNAEQSKKAADVSVNEFSEQPEISVDDLNLVNEYVRNNGADEIMSASAEGLQSMIYENKQTKEQKNAWQLVVDFVRNETSDNPKELDYMIGFDGSSFSVSEDNWEFIGYEPEPS